MELTRDWLISAFLLLTICAGLIGLLLLGERAVCAVNDPGPSYCDAREAEQ